MSSNDNREIETVFQIVTQLVENVVENVVAQIEKVIEEKPKLKIQIGEETVMGGGRENQDNNFVIHLDNNNKIIGMIDGHGTISGKIISTIVSQRFHEYLHNNMTMLLETPVEFLATVFKYIHNKIREDLVIEMNRIGYEAQLNDLGYVIHRRYSTQAFTNLKGGATFSVIILLGTKMYIANVGDSAGLLCCKQPVLTPSLVKYEMDVAVPGKTQTNGEKSDVPLNYMELTCDHSPQNPNEYIRARNFRCYHENPNFADMIFVYDNQNLEKHLCPPIFNISETGVPTVKDCDGSCTYYYKNVNREKATYVCSETGEDAVAFTRSLADFKINDWGVSCDPEIQSVDLETVFEKMRLHRGLDTDTSPLQLCVVLCTDGVWDNWINDHVYKFVMDPSCLRAIADKPDEGATRVAKSFMARNTIFNNKNFGSSRDDASCIVMYVSLEL
jgi:serine/threonine protein phosphatase PrpC